MGDKCDAVVQTVTVSVTVWIRETKLRVCLLLRTTGSGVAVLL